MKNKTNGPEEKGEGLAYFIKYNNAIPIALGALFFATTATFAATPAVRDAVYSSETAVRSVDNSYIRSVNLGRYPFSMRITAVAEDEQYYFLDYDFDTIDIADSAWRDVTVKKTLRIAKALLGAGDLHAYAESELGQVLDSEKQRLTETQAFERRQGASEKTVATVYRGLVGKFIDSSEDAFPAYQPPPLEQNEENPLAIKNPKPLITWDENAIASEAPQTEGEAGRRKEFTDLCPDKPGIQLAARECPPAEPPLGDTPPEETTSTPEDPVPAENPEPSPEPEPAGENPSDAQETPAP